MTRLNSKILIIGIDGGTWDVLAPACDKGWMPNLDKFRTEGIWGVLNSTYPPITPAAWTTFMTGMNPGHHGVRGFFDFDPVKRKTILTNSSSIRKETIWQKLARHDKKMVVVGVPMTYPPLKVNGILVSGFGTPSTNCGFTYPQEFQQDVLNKIPELKFSVPLTRKELRQEDKFGQYLDYLYQSSMDMVTILKMGMEKVQWTVSMVLIRSFDEMLHNFWKIFDFSWDTSSNSRNKIIKRYFIELDKIIGELLDIASQNRASVVAISDHGGQAKLGTIYPNKILSELGYLKRLPRHKLLLQSIQRRLYRTFPSLSSSTHKHPDDKIKSIDFDLSQAVVTGINSYADLFIQKNTNKTKSEVINELKQKLLDVKMPDGQPFFQLVRTPDELYNLEHHDDAFPDLMLAPREGFSLSARATNKGYVKYASKNSLSGYHSLNGIIGMMGTGINVGKEIKADIADITPTILAMLGLPVTKDMDGSVINEAFTEPLTVQYEESICSDKDKSYSYSDTEESVINSRLADLGYF